MIEVTQGATNILKQMLAQVDAPETHSIRVTLSDSGFAAVPDEVRSDDVAIVKDEDGQPLMVADQPVADRLDGHTLDFNPTSSQLVLS